MGRKEDARSVPNLFLFERPRTAAIVSPFPVVEAVLRLLDGEMFGLDLLHDVDQLALTARHAVAADHGHTRGALITITIIIVVVVDVNSCGRGTRLAGVCRLYRQLRDVCTT